MSNDDIDLDRVVVDPDYRRQVIEFLNGNDNCDRSDDPVAHIAHRFETVIQLDRP